MHSFLDLGAYAAPDWAHALSSPPPQRYSLARLPTPVHRWHLPHLPDGVELWIKRDDLTGMQLSGNKVRKLEFILAEAKARGHDCVVTLGGIQSNHARATAVAARYCGLESHLVLRTSRAVVDQDPGLRGNLLVERMAGAHIHLVTKEEYAREGQAALGSALVALLRAQGAHPYLIPVGGSGALGVWGYLEMVRELQAQMREQGLQLTDLVMACGSGGTTAGVALGNHLSGLGLRVHAYGVCDSPSYFYEYIDGLFAELGATPAVVGAGAGGMVRCVQAKGAGYALSLPEELETVAEVALSSGVVLDPVYTGKAVHGLLSEMHANPEAWRGRKVLFLHTGGLLGLYEQAPQLQPLVERLGRVQRMQVGAAPAAAGA